MNGKISLNSENSFEIKGVNVYYCLTVVYRYCQMKGIKMPVEIGYERSEKSHSFYIGYYFFGSKLQYTNFKEILETACLKYNLEKIQIPSKTKIKFRIYAK